MAFKNDIVKFTSGFKFLRCKNPTLGRVNHVSIGGLFPRFYTIMCLCHKHDYNKQKYDWVSATEEDIEVVLPGDFQDKVRDRLS